MSLHVILKTGWSCQNSVHATCLQRDQNQLPANFHKWCNVKRSDIKTKVCSVSYKYQNKCISKAVFVDEHSLFASESDIESPWTVKGELHFSRPSLSKYAQLTASANQSKWACPLSGAWLPATTLNVNTVWQLLHHEPRRSSFEWKFYYSKRNICQNVSLVVLECLKRIKPSSIGQIWACNDELSGENRVKERPDICDVDWHTLCVFFHNKSWK